MKNKLFLTINELKNYGSTSTLSEQASSLLRQQKENWELLRNNFDNLNNIKSKIFNFEYFQLKLQFNPARIKSSSAKVDKETISERPCFLCNENLPEVQKGILYNEKYILLCNPFPIFKQHLTIPHINHIPQRIENSFIDLLKLSYDLRHNFFVFYNGPNCGASAPDHLHFQAGLKNSTPLENDYKNILQQSGNLVISNNTIKVYSVTNSLRNFIFIKSSSLEKTNEYFLKVLTSLLSGQKKKDDEPLLNIVAFYENDSWNVFVFPRKAHRPAQYFAEGKNKILFSPAAAEMTGVCITPREEDFNKITKDILADMFNQVTLNKKEMEIIADNLF